MADFGWWELHRDGTAEQRGVNWGNATPIQVWFRNAEFIVFKIPGGSHWVGVGMDRASHPGCYFVGRIDLDAPEAAGEGAIKVHRLFKMPLRSGGVLPPPPDLSEVQAERLEQEGIGAVE
jgi:hypothetical protein